jgi:hypothetical protein
MDGGLGSDRAKGRDAAESVQTTDWRIVRSDRANSPKQLETLSREFMLLAGAWSFERLRPQVDAIGEAERPDLQPET